MEVGYRGGAAGVWPWPLPVATLRQLELHAVAHQFAHGQRVPRAGGAEEHIHYIRKGRVRAVLHGPGGQDKILAILDAGALVGDSTVLHWSGPSVAFYAAELTETWSWPRSFIFDLLRDDAQIAVFLVASLARKVQLLTAQVHALTFADAGERVIQTFVHLAQLYGEPAGDGALRIGLRLTQSEVGEMANASRVTVNKVFQRLKREKLMSKRAGYFIVHDLHRLSRRSRVRRGPALKRWPDAQGRARTVPPVGSSGSDNRRS